MQHPKVVLLLGENKSMMAPYTMEEQCARIPVKKRRKVRKLEGTRLKGIDRKNTDSFLVAIHLGEFQV